MATFVRGMKVRLPATRPADADAYPGWNDRMTRMLGTVVTIIEPSHGATRCWIVEGHLWKESWLEPIEEPPAKPRSFKYGDVVRIHDKMHHAHLLLGRVSCTEGAMGPGTSNVVVDMDCGAPSAGKEYWFNNGELEFLCQDNSSMARVTPAPPVTVTAHKAAESTWTTSKQTWGIGSGTGSVIIANPISPCIISMPESLHARAVDVLSGLSDSHIPSLGQVQAIRAVLHDLMGLVKREKGR